MCRDLTDADAIADAAGAGICTETDRRDRRADRPRVPGPERRRAVGRHADRFHLRPRRAAWRSPADLRNSAGLGQLGFSTPTDHPRPLEGDAAAVVEAFTEAVDLMPTLLDWFGLDIPPACDGVSLLPWLACGETPLSLARSPCPLRGIATCPRRLAASVAASPSDVSAGGRPDGGDAPGRVEIRAFHRPAADACMISPPIPRE